MSDTSQGRHLLTEKDFVDVVIPSGGDDDEDLKLDPVPKHWGPEQLPAGAEVVKKGGRSSAKSAKSAPVIPNGNASREEWAEYALTHGGLAAEDLVVDGKELTRDEIRAKLTPPD